MGYFLNKPIFSVLSKFLIVLVELRLCSAENSRGNFVFGDSLVDVGNNNYIVSLSKADYLPNGIDFGAPTGRFTNGRTIVDILGHEIGFIGYTPPYLAPSTDRLATLLQGVNYASGGGGILNSTGKIFVGRINLDTQIDNFANTRQEIISSMGPDEADKLLKNSFFSVTIGSNDFINNYLTPFVPSEVEKQLQSPESFVASMISKFRIQLTRLYNMGARKIVIANVGPIGCIPYQREITADAGEGCAPLANQLAQMFNTQLRGLVVELAANLQGSRFIYADVYHIVDDIVQNYTLYGFDNANSACCYVAGRYGGLIPCGPPSKVCVDRSKYVFWDPYHPTDAANSIIAMRLLDGDSRDIWPVNIRQLMKSGTLD